MNLIRIMANIIKKYFLFIMLVPIVILSQLIILEPHLRYGFSDVDWGFLSFYQTYKQQYPNVVVNLLKTFESWGVYTHQSYYIGFQAEFFGMDFKSYQVTTHLFKILATIAIFPFIFIITQSKLTAFLSVLLFAFSYPAVGTMYTVVTSSDYTAVLAMGIFLWVYCFIIKYNKNNLIWLTVAMILLVITLFLSTERMYPLVAFLGVSEFFMFLVSKEKISLFKVMKRILVISAPIILVFLIKPMLFVDFVARNGIELITRISKGDWQLILTPVISLGSMVSPHNFWRYLGVVKVDNFRQYLDFFVNGPLIVFGVVTILVGILAFPKAIKFIIQTLLLTVIFSTTAFFLAVHHKSHFDQSFVAPALIGIYLLSFSVAAFNQWWEFRERLYLGLFMGPIFAFIYILLTWIAADTSLVFTGVHRYLTVPAIGIALFWGSLVVLISKRLWKIKSWIRFLAFMPFLIVVPLVSLGAFQINDFFKDQLYHGFGASDKQMMRGQLLSYLDNISDKNPSLFYFDFTEDNNHGYYYDNTVLGGFKTWLLWHKNINFREDLIPEVFWNNQELLKSSIYEKTGNRGFLYQNRFYDISDFYAFKLKDKRVIDIKDEVLAQLEF